MHKFFVHASALKRLKSRAMLHGEIAILFFPLYLPIKGKNRELHPNIVLLLNTDELALKGWRISTKTIISPGNKQRLKKTGLLSVP